MRLAFFDDYKLGVVVGDKIVDVSSVAKGIKALGPQDVIRTVIEIKAGHSRTSNSKPRRQLPRCVRQARGR
jgi:hypothetical protein